ncbi:hypothetical protein L2E82_39888 [Cichorium intybus]|uniref:Uncharacterized protein n=1 Tax=Cichorium intybus TaxID=13427 RepID=A0ACB9AIS9_CICIN|nr:hypothetical protein L2E82_39888 [Cichorium intybus]
MMNWGTKKTLQTKIVSPKTWLLRFKKMKDGQEPKSGNAQRKWKNKGRVHDGDDDGFHWRISFDKEKYEDEETTCNSDDRVNVSPRLDDGDDDRERNYAKRRA